MKRKGRKYVYWPHPSDRTKWVKARELRDGRLKIVEVVPRSRVPGKRRR